MLRSALSCAVKTTDVLISRPPSTKIRNQHRKSTRARTSRREILGMEMGEEHGSGVM